MARRVGWCAYAGRLQKGDLMDDSTHLADRCRALVAQLRKPSSDLHRTTPKHADAALLEDHLLTTAALVSCLAAGTPERDLLRLAALAHDLPDDERAGALGPHAEEVRPWIELLHAHGEQLDRLREHDATGHDGAKLALPPDGADRLLALAHLAASNRLPMRAKDDFDDHPLAGELQVDLVYGGATKVKQYVFESARLPEIRGASALLDHINRLDLPALWGQSPTPPGELRQARYQATRDWFAKRFDATPLDAPECVLYASGGNILALAPAGQGAQLAQAIERRYTEETQVAQSVAVASSFSLLELQYGRRPQTFWLDDLDGMLSQPALRRVLIDSYGIDTEDLYDAPAFQRWAAGAGALSAADTAVVRAWIFGRDSLADEDARRLKPDRPIGARKGFGELVTLLAAQADRRRAGDGAGTGTTRFPVFVDLPSAARRCGSCDVRPAAHNIPPPTGIVLCDACRHKRDAGLAAKKGPRDDDTAPPDQKLDWIQPWGDWLERMSKELQRTRDIKATVNTLPDIAEAAHGLASGFVGLIYADGNNVGAHVAGLASIAAYRRFAQQMLDANERAVALALLEHLGPSERNKIWPFEIITIGGDDVLLFVPADRAPVVAATIAREFGQAMNAYGTTITLSAGVLLMADHTPVRFARDLVESLLKSAKQRSKDGDRGPTIDFMALKAASMVSETIGAYRQVAYRRTRRRKHGEQTRETRLHLTQRPYTLDDFEKLLDAGRTLERANFPRSQLHQLAEIVGEGQQLRASIDYSYFVERGRGRGGPGNAYADFDSAIGALCKSEESAPWRTLPGRPDRQEYDTPLLDLVEILPFIGPAKREERA
jgi:CRISPR-associated protein Cmr2